MTEREITHDDVLIRNAELEIEQMDKAGPVPLTDDMIEILRDGEPCKGSTWGLLSVKDPEAGMTVSFGRGVILATIAADRARIAESKDLLRRLLSKLSHERRDYSGVGWCAGCGAVLYCSGDDQPRDPCKSNCVLQEALRAAEKGGCDEAV